MIRAAKHSSGYILLSVVVAIVLIAAIAVMTSQQSGLEVNNTVSEFEATQAEYVAQAGLQHGIRQAMQQGCGPYTDLTNTAFGSDQYSTTLTTDLGSTTPYLVPTDQDTWIRNDNTSANMATDWKLHIRYEAGNIERPMYKYDLSAIPANASILSATAWFYINKEHAEGPVDIHRLQADWQDNTATWNTMGDQMDPTVIATIPTQPARHLWVQVNLTSQVQAWVNGQPNYGITLNSTSEGTNGEYVGEEDASHKSYINVIVGTAPSSPVSLQSVGTLTSGVTRTLLHNDVTLQQSPTSFIHWQHDATLGEDVEIWNQQPDNNYGNAAETWVSSASNDTTHTLLHFNMGKVPAGARILGATLSLDRQSGFGSDQPVSAHRIKNSWSEDSVTWNSRKSGINWDTAGSDFDSMAVATTPVGPVNQRYEWNITPLAQGWIDSSYPNHGVALIAAIAGMAGEQFYTSDHADPTRRPSLSITYTCECGNACIAPQGEGNLLLVVNIPTSLTENEAYKKSLFESWGYTVSLINDDDNQATYNAALANNDVVYISEKITGSTLGNKLSSTSKGVISEEGRQNVYQGTSSDFANATGDAIDIIDNSHYITAPFATGNLPIYDAPMDQLTTSGTLATDQQTLANAGGVPGLVLVEKGGVLADGFTPAPGRRVMLPIGREVDTNFDWMKINSNGLLLVQRAIEWGANNSVIPPAGNLLLIVGNASSPSTKDLSYQTLMESWGYTVTLLDDGDSQANYDTAMAATDIIYVSGSASGASMRDKATFTNKGMVNEVNGKIDNFGFASITSSTATFNTFSDTDATHYITEPFNGNPVTVFTSSLTNPVPGGTLAPDLQNVGEVSGILALGTLDIGATRYDGNPSQGRRVHLPFQLAETTNLTSDGETIIKRSIEWAATVIPTVAPIAHWKLDETTGTIVVDSVGGHDGTLTGSTWTTGKIDGGLIIDDPSEKIQVPHDISLSLTNAFTLTAWIKTNAISAGYECVIGKTNGIADNYWFGIISDELVLEFLISGTWYTFSTPDANLLANTWYHIAASFDDANDSVRLYIDGVEALSDTFMETPVANTADIIIGNSVYASENWDGILDDIRIYDQAILATDIAQLVADTNGGGSDPEPFNCNGTYRDEFNAKELTASDGTIDWSTSSWAEVGERDGITMGDVKIIDDDNNDGHLYRLRIRDNNNRGEGMEREANLNGATVATLTFDYRRMGLDNSNDYVAVYASSSGTAGIWTELDRIGTNNDAIYQSYSRDISSFISANTAIRLRSSISMGNRDTVWFDNVQIECIP